MGAAINAKEEVIKSILPTLCFSMFVGLKDFIPLLSFKELAASAANSTSSNRSIISVY